MDVQSGQVSSQPPARRADKPHTHAVESRTRRLMADELTTSFPGEPAGDGATSKRALYLEQRALGRGAGAKALTWRAVGIGLVLVAFVAAFTPYNDYVLQNS